MQSSVQDKVDQAILGALDHMKGKMRRGRPPKHGAVTKVSTSIDGGESVSGEPMSDAGSMSKDADQAVPDVVHVGEKRKRGRPRKNEAVRNTSIEDGFGLTNEESNRCDAQRKKSRGQDKHEKTLSDKAVGNRSLTLVTDFCDTTNVPRKGKIGRPLKYTRLLASLKDDVAYAPASIVQHAIHAGLAEEILRSGETAFKVWNVKVRHTMARFAKNHGFPRQGDEMIMIPGQSLLVGWKGWRWKKAAGLAHAKPREGEGEGEESCSATGGEG